MHDEPTQRRFVELRSQGWTFARIVQELGVSKPTLIAWSRKFQFDIQNQRAIELEALAEQFVQTTAHRVRWLGEQLQRAEAELVQRDLKDLSTAQLHALVRSLRQQIQRETGAMQFTTPLEEIPAAELREQAQTWTP